MNSFPKSIAIVGSGALGSYYGAKLARQGVDVRFLMRADLEAVKAKGLTVREQGEEWTVPAQAFGSTEEIGAVDLVIIGLKTTANADLEKLIPPLLHEGTLLLTLQNGLGNEELLAERWGVERVLGGLCFVCLNRLGPGVIEHYGHGTLSLGEYRRTPMERTWAIGAQFSAAGVETHVVENLITERWRKLVWNIPFNGLSIAAGRTCDLLLANEAPRSQVRALMGETITAARALGHLIPEDFADFQIERTYSMGPVQAFEHDRLATWAIGGSGIDLGRTLAAGHRGGCGIAAIGGALQTALTDDCTMSGMALSLDVEVLPKAVRDFQPEWGIILGSGLGSLVDEVGAILSLPYEEITGMPVSTAPGHAGRFVFGRLAGCRVLMAQGRVHLYEGRTAEEVTATVRFMESLGVRKLLLTNAAGTLHPEFAPRSWMILKDHLNLTGTSPLVGGANFVDMSAIYSRALRERFHAAAMAEGVTLHEGVYAGLLGPQYETPAEVRMLRVLGADAVGMSTVLEAIQARALGMEVAGFSCLTNWAAGLSDQALSHEEVLATGKSAAESMLRMLTRALGVQG